MSPDGESAIVAGLENNSLILCVFFSKEQGEVFVEALLADKKKVTKFKADIQKSMLPDMSTRPPVKITGTAARALGVYLTSSGTGDREDVFNSDGFHEGLVAMFVPTPPNGTSGFAIFKGAESPILDVFYSRAQAREMVKTRHTLITSANRSMMLAAIAAADMPESSDIPPASFDGFVGAAVMSGIITYDKQKLMN